MKISQREAHRLRKRVNELEAAEAKRRRTWSSDWPGGVNIDTLDLAPASMAAIRTAHRLGHAAILLPDDQGTRVRVMALPHPAMDI